MGRDGGLRLSTINPRSGNRSSARWNSLQGSTCMRSLKKLGQTRYPFLSLLSCQSSFRLFVPGVRRCRSLLYAPQCMR